MAEKYPIHVVCAWIGNTAHIANKHYLQVTDEPFRQGAERTVLNGGKKSGAESDALAVQKAVQQPAARSRTKKQ